MTEPIRAALERLSEELLAIAAELLQQREVELQECKALCAELADSVELLLDLRTALHQGRREFKQMAIAERCLERARVALAEQPTPPAEERQ